MYTRVIPRDLFNEAKLLKSLGQLALILHDGCDKLRPVNPRWRLRIEHCDEDNDDKTAGFEIQQNDDGDLVCTNIWLYAGDSFLPLASKYNSKDAYPLFFGEHEGSVLDDDGNLHEELVEYLNGL